MAIWTADDLFRKKEKKYGKKNTIPSIPRNLEPQMAHQWEVTFKGIDGGENEDVKLYAQSTGIPAIMTDAIKRRYLGKEYTYAGKDNSPKIFRVTFWDNDKLEVYHYFQKWSYLTNDPEGGLGVSPKNYMREISLRLFDVTGENTVEDFRFGQCFPTEISEASLSYEVSAALTFDVIFSFNYRLSGV